MLKDAWKQRAEQAKHSKSALKKQLAALDKQQDVLIGRLVDATNPKLATALERKIAKLEEDTLRVRDQNAQNTAPRTITPEIIELLEKFLSSPWKIYERGSLAMKKTILNMVFTAPLVYDRKEGYRTPQASVIFRFFEKITSKCEMVRSERLELSRVLPHSDLNAARLPFRHDRTPWMVWLPIARVTK